MLNADRDAVITRGRESRPLDVPMVNAGIGAFDDPLVSWI
jgi:hypothetical protein